VFCILEKDGKTYSYLKDYIDFLENDKGNILFYDNYIQYMEIEEHIKLNNCTEKENECIRWIDNYASDFRQYINSIKLLYMAWKIKSVNSLNWDSFCELVDKLNDLKDKCRI